MSPMARSDKYVNGGMILGPGPLHIPPTASFYAVLALTSHRRAGGIFLPGLAVHPRLIVISSLQRRFNTLRQYDTIHNIISDIADGDGDTTKCSN